MRTSAYKNILAQAKQEVNENFYQNNPVGSSPIEVICPHIQAGNTQ